MRNLKRALSLALASVMMLSMMVVGTGASYTDPETITDTQAVDVLTAVGVFEGYEDGSFGGDNTVTRAQMAKILIYIYKGADYDTSAYADMGIFSDVSSSHWADEVISAAVAEGLILGYEDGTFAPNEVVTTAEAAIMLGRAVGYFQNSEDTGSSWKLNAIKYGTDIGILSGLSLGSSAELTRDDVASMVFNTIIDGVIVTYSDDDGDGLYAYETGVDKSLSNEYLADNLGLLGTTNVSAFGRPVIEWDLDGDIVATTAIDPDYTFVTEDDVMGEIGVSGAYITDSSAEYLRSTYTANSSNTYTESDANGEVVEVYLFNDADGAENAYIIKYNYYATEVTKVSYDDDDNETTITVKDDVYVSTKMTIVVDGESDFAVGDAVVVSATGIGSSYDLGDIMLSESFVTGTATASASTYVKLDGVEYTYSMSDPSPTLGEECTVTLDPNGYVIDFEGETTSTSTDYVLIVETQKGTSFTDGMAQIVFEDGSQETVVWDSVTAGNVDENTVYTIATYSVSDGEYYFVAVDTKDMLNSAIGTDVLTYDSYEATLDTIFVDVDEAVAYVGLDNVVDYTTGGNAYYVVNDSYELVTVFMVGATASSSTSDDTYVYITETDYEAQLGDDGETYYVYSAAYVDGVLTELWVDDYTSIVTENALYKISTVNDYGYVTALSGASAALDEDYTFVKMVSSSKLYFADGSSYSFDDDTVFVLIDATDYYGSRDAEDIVVYEGSYTDISAYDSSVDTSDIVTYVSFNNDDDNYLEIVYIYMNYYNINGVKATASANA